MYKDYLEAITKYYHEREQLADFPLRLRQPTPSKLRDECISVYKQGVDQRDLPMLQSFFGVQAEANLLTRIERVDIDKFRPLVNYLKGGTGATEDKNIELLGWLVGFPKRPYSKEHNYGYEESPAVEKGGRTSQDAEVEGNFHNGHLKGEAHKEPEGEFVSGDNCSSNTAGRNLKKKARRLFAGLIILGSAATVIYFLARNNTGFDTIEPGRKECMVWMDDHYEPISCDSPSRGALILGVDKKALKDLRRITRPDTITEKHIGKLWYKKRTRDSLDYYTAGGMDPIKPSRDLDRLTSHIFNKYLSKKK